MSRTSEGDSASSGGFDTNLYTSSHSEAWSDVTTISLSSLDIDSCVNISKQDDQKECDNELYIPPELMEKIVTFFDGRSLIKFKSLSKVCNDIADNALRYNKLWKQICLNEIPKKYLFEILNKRFEAHIPYDSLSEVEYEDLYKHWLGWQNTVFNVKRIEEQHFFGFDEIKQINCFNFDVMIVFSKRLSIFTLCKSVRKADKYKVQETVSENIMPNTFVMLNPQRQIDINGESHNVYIAQHLRSANICPLHCIKSVDAALHDKNCTKYAIGKLIDVDINTYINTCCWVRETWYEWYSCDEINVKNGHYCSKLSNIMYTSVVHGLIISRQNNNSILIHEIYKDFCRTICSWLNYKYVGATAVYIYANILFIGTQNGYLLAYRLQCWDDFIVPKEYHLLLEKKLGIGQILKLNLIDFMNMKIVIASSRSSVLWMKID